MPADFRISELDELDAIAADDDWLVVVDRSDTSMGPQGTTKKVRRNRVAAIAAPTQVLTQAEYDALATKDPATIYFVTS